MNSQYLQQQAAEVFELLEEEKFGKAFLGFKKLTDKSPRDSALWMGYASAACAVGRFDLAEHAWRAAKKINPDDANILLEIGHRYEGMRHSETAREYYEEAAAADPKSINPRISMALLWEKEQRFSEARRSVEQCFAIDRADEQAQYVSALLCTRENQLEEAERQFRTLIASEPKHEYVRYAVRYELAEILDRTARYDEAMEELMEAKKLVMALADSKILFQQYDAFAVDLRQQAGRYPKDILNKWAKTFPEKKRNQIPRFAFLGGHPRSGTTLLERVLGTHPEIGAIDEPMITRIAFKAVSQQPWGNPAAPLNVGRRDYIRALQHVLGESEGKLLLEKNPSPTAQLPVLLRLFPELKVIIALRDPRDVVMSCYFQNIPLNQVNANFLTFERLVEHYANLMEVWLTVRQWESFSWIETRYEDTVADLEKEGRRVTQFLGLEWHESQARYFEPDKRVRAYSPTYHDVTQPIYNRSVGRWRHYQKYIEPILPALEPYCWALGYS